MTSDLVLSGCGPVPLGSYLKALGVFRLVTEQADPDAQGFWRDERFVLRTRLSEVELIAFFVERYAPGPILSPWNGRAGFLEGEEEEGVESKRKGAELVRVYEQAGTRFLALKSATTAYKVLPVIDQLNRSRSQAKPLQEKKRKKQPLTYAEKEELSRLLKEIDSYKRDTLTMLRSGAPEQSLQWLDACMRIAAQGAKSSVAPLLGAGGADGSRDFGMGFGLALTSLFDLASGAPSTACEPELRAALLDSSVSSLRAGNVGLFQPGAVGENQSSGFRGELPLNNWDFVLLLEGVVLFAGSVARRLSGAESARASFPFTVDALTAGTGATGPQDDKGFAEFWAPLWSRPTGLTELATFLREGRTTLGRRGVATGLDFAVAAVTYGAQRGVASFQRHAILVREPRSPRKATSLGRVGTTGLPHAGIVGDARPWLARLKWAIEGGEAGKGLLIGVRRAEDALYGFAKSAGPAATRSGAQAVLVAMGHLIQACARRPKLREDVPPPPRLDAEWHKLADDGSAEFKLAAALAGLAAATAPSADRKITRLPFRAHLAPLAIEQKGDAWGNGTEAEARAVWTGRDLARDLRFVLVRRLIEAQRTSFVRRDASGAESAELPLRGYPGAPLWAVAAFLAGATDDRRIADLAAGLAWVRGEVAARPRADAGAVDANALLTGALDDAQPAKASQSEGRNDGIAAVDTARMMQQPYRTRDHALPFAYAAIKPLLRPDGVGPERRPVDPLRIIRLLDAGRLAEAIRAAQRMARGTGLPAPFAKLDVAAGVDAARLAAALLIPLTPHGDETLVARAYPDPSLNEDTTDAT